MTGPLSVVIAFLVCQIAVASYQLTQPRPARFGWQMYAGISQPVDLQAVTASGFKPVDLSDYLARQRGDLDVAAVVPAICEREQASAVRYRIIPEKQAREVRCAS